MNNGRQARGGAGRTMPWTLLVEGAPVAWSNCTPVGPFVSTGPVGGGAAS